MEPLHRLADEIRETFSNEQHTIESALDANPSFRRNRAPESALVRCVVTTAVESLAPPLGLRPKTLPGGAVEFSLMAGSTAIPLGLGSPGGHPFTPSSEDDLFGDESASATGS